MHHSVVAAKHRSERLNASLDSVSVFSFQRFSFLLFFHAFQGNKIYCSQLQHHCLCTVAALFMHCLWDPQLLYSEKKIKNWSHDTIHTFKNYFVTIFSVFSFSKNKFNTNGPLDYFSNS